MNLLLRSLRRVALPAHSALRKRKVELFFKSFNPSAADTLLDVGGGTGEAGELAPIYNFFPQLTCLNLNPTAKNGHARLVLGDACQMPFESKSFDFVFSNAVIEHVGRFDRQQQMANEIRRVARKGYFVATPNRWFPIDPHSYLPYFQLMPLRVRRMMNPHDDYWMLSPATMRKLFPDSSVAVTPEGTSIIAIGTP